MLQCLRVGSAVDSVEPNVASPIDQPDSQSSSAKRPQVEMERASLRSSANSDFPWMTREYEAIQTRGSRSPLQKWQEVHAVDRYASVRSGQASHDELPKSFGDLSLIASDMDYYAGAVSDHVCQNVWKVDRDIPEDDEGRGCFGHVRIIPSGDVQRTTPRRSEKVINIVTWDGPDDPENPKNWTRRRKWLATMMVSLLTFVSPVSSSMIAPALEQIKNDLHISSDLEVELALSAFILGFALGPLLLGPVSELFGRKPVLLLGGMFYFTFNLAAGFAHHAAELIAFRFLSGLGGSAPLGIGGGVLADIWIPRERGRAMALYSLMPLLGPAIGPVAGGFIARWSTWRWVFWSTSVVAFLVILLSTVLLRETHAPAILSRRRRHLAALTGSSNLCTEFDRPDRSLPSHLRTALARPFVMLLTQPIVQLLAIYIGYLFGVLYLVLASFSRVWASRYGEDPAAAGLNYVSLGLGFLLATRISARFADRIYRRLEDRRPAVSSGDPAASVGGRPEFRVPLMVPGAAMVPAGLLIYGWAAHARAHWIVPDLGAALFAAGNQLVFQSCQVYLVDAYARHAASAIAATAVLRSLGGFAFPLFADAMYGALGDGWGNTLLALVGVVVGLLLPALLWWGGEGMRGRSGYAAG